MTKGQILMYAKILEACAGGLKTAVYNHKLDIGLGGVVRHIVEEDNCGFPVNITPKCRLRITSTMDIFIPLVTITSAEVYQDTLILEIG